MATRETVLTIVILATVTHARYKLKSSVEEGKKAKVKRKKATRKGSK